MSGESLAFDLTEENAVNVKRSERSERQAKRAAQMTQILQVYSKRTNQHKKQGCSNLTKEYGTIYANNVRRNGYNAR